MRSWQRRPQPSRKRWSATSEPAIRIRTSQLGREASYKVDAEPMQNSVLLSSAR